MKLPLSNGGTQVHNTHLPGYSEPDALEILLNVAHNEMLEDLEQNEATGDWSTDQILISVGGTTCAFYLGGPQFDALIAFVNHICGENLYELDLDNLEVKGW